MDPDVNRQHDGDVSPVQHSPPLQVEFGLRWRHDVHGHGPRHEQGRDVSPVQHSSSCYVEYGEFRQHSSKCNVSTHHISPSHQPVVKKEPTTPPHPTRVVKIKKEPPDIIEIMSTDEEGAIPVKKTDEKPATPPKKATSVKKKVSDKPKLFLLFSKGYKPPIVEKSSDEDDVLIPVLVWKKQLVELCDYKGTVMHDGKANCAIFSVREDKACNDSSLNLAKIR